MDGRPNILEIFVVPYLCIRYVFSALSLFLLGFYRFRIRIKPLAIKVGHFFNIRAGYGLLLAIFLPDFEKAFK